MTDNAHATTPQRRRIVIVGGGTAGWLAAWIMHDNITRTGAAVELVMVESSAIPTIGVGEGTTAVFKGFLDHFRLNEADFLRETRATYKLGIRHRNWYKGEPYYDGPIDDPHLSGNVPGPPGNEILNIYAVAEGRRVTQSHHFSHLMRANKVPFMRNDDGTLARVSPFENAYHFDNTKVADWLRTRAKGLEIMDAVVVGVQTDADGKRITSLELEGGHQLTGDFFVDCTGFKRLLLQAVAGLDWISYAQELPLNRAFPFQLPHPDNGPVLPYTHAWAQDNGWLWQIPTQDRIGNGYAYCDAFTTPEQAQAEIETRFGMTIEPLADLSFEVGRLRHSWVGNCLAIGLSAGFLEPLEATSIHSTIIQLLVFERDYMANALDIDAIEREKYNDIVARQFDDFRTFLVIHYRGGRTDTPFWQHVQDNCNEDRAQERLMQWQSHMPIGSDFNDFLRGLPHVEAQLYYPILDGLRLLDRNIARRELSASGQSLFASRAWRLKVAEAKQVANHSIDHRTFLSAIDAGTEIRTHS